MEEKTEYTFPMNEDEVLEAINTSDIDAFDLLLAADHKLSGRWTRMTNNMKKFLKDVRHQFPDAQYYTAGGGFNLMLGAPHGRNERPQQELVALGSVGLFVGDGDF